MKRIKKTGNKIIILKDKAITSARRWAEQGIFKLTIKNKIILLLYFFGVSPEKLLYVYRKKNRN